MFSTVKSPLLLWLLLFYIFFIEHFGSSDHHARGLGQNLVYACRKWKRLEMSFLCGRHYILPTKTTSIERDWDWILDILWHVIPTKEAYDVLMYSPLGDSLFFCFELYYIWEIAFSPTKDEDNEYNRILANIVHDVLKHVSDISWGYVIHI